MRSANQVQRVYEQRAERGQGEMPYVLEYENNGKLLIFFGARHSNDLQDSQWNDLDKKWQRFIGHSNRTKIALYEGGYQPLKEQNREEALRQFSESGLILWLAQEDNIPAECPEPDRAEEVRHLKSKGYDDAVIMTYYFGRQMDQWVSRDYLNEPEWKTYAQHFISQYDALGCWDQPLHLELVLEWFRKTSGKDFDVRDADALYSLSDPYQSRVSETSGAYRDQQLFDAIKAKWEAGNNVFVVYGSGHAITLEPALEVLTRQ